MSPASGHASIVFHGSKATSSGVALRLHPDPRHCSTCTIRTSGSASRSVRPPADRCPHSTSSPCCIRGTPSWRTCRRSIGARKLSQAISCARSWVCSNRRRRDSTPASDRLRVRCIPATAKGPWLDFIARWLGVALGRRAERRAEEAHRFSRGRSGAHGRGTRAGTRNAARVPAAQVRRLAIASPTPPRTSDSRLLAAAPAAAACCLCFLEDARSGAPSSVRTLCSGTCACRAPGRWTTVCASSRDSCVSTSPRPARSGSAWEPWLPALIKEMVPLTARLQLQWVESAGAARYIASTARSYCRAAPTPHLGSDAVTGVARLPERGSRITSTGADIGTRLQ